MAGKELFLLDSMALVVSIVLMVFVVETIRRSRLNARYAILWLGAGVVLLTLSIYRPLLDYIAKAVGVSYPPSRLFQVAFLFLLCIVLHYSLVISSHRDSIRRLAQTVALLEQELEEQRALKPAGHSP
jgi:hypothetical protein